MTGRTNEGELVRKLPVIYDDVICAGKEMNIGDGIMYTIIKNPLVRAAYFAKNLMLHFIGEEYRHKTYVVRPR